jgi:hypothetical protein
VTEIDDSIWDEEVQNYRVEQVIEPLRDALAYFNPPIHIRKRRVPKSKFKPKTQGVRGEQ